MESATSAMMNARRTARSRYLLPMELLLAVVMVVVSAHGFLIKGEIERAAVSWILGLGIVGGVWFHVAAIEWCEGFTWSLERLRKWVYLRKWLAIISIAVWCYVIDTLLNVEEPSRLAVLFVGIAAIVPFHVWSWWVNYRTWVVLNPKFSTKKLEAQLATVRTRW